MKNVVLVLVGVAVLGLLAGLASADKEHADALRGQVVRVEGTTVVVKTTEAEVNVATDEKTMVTIDGKEAKVEDLKAGMKVTVMPAEGVATKIKAMSPKTEKW